MKFYKTTIVLEVLHTIGDDIGNWELGDIVKECDTGSFSGDTKSLETVEVTADEMRVLLEDQRSDPGFFDYDEDEEES